MMQASLTDRLQFVDAFRRLCAAYGKDLDEQRLEAYQDALASVAIEQLEAGMRRAAVEERYFPTPKVIREWAALVAREEHERAQAKAQAQAQHAGAQAHGPHCSECDDYGWVRSTVKPAIYGGEVEVTRVRRCPCWDTNPVRLARRVW